MNWEQVCADPSLQDLPYKIELNEYGQIVMSPASNQHCSHQVKLAILLNEHIPDGEAITECSIDTDKGVKVADVAWISAAFQAEHGYSTPYPRAPEICVGITSPSNSTRELKEKIALYFQRGAKEVWVCDSFGNMDFHAPDGTLKASGLLPEFPERI